MRAVITATAFGDATIERAILEEAGFDVDITDARTGDELVDAAATATALLVQYAEVDGATLLRLPELRLISRYGVGVDTIDLEAAGRQGVLVANVPRYGGDEVALHATSLVLGLLRHLPGFDRSVRQGAWDHRATGGIVAADELTLGLYGLGRVGRTVADRAGVWFGEVIAHDPHLQDGGDVELVGLDELFERADVLSIHVPSTPQTDGSVDRRRLRLLGPGGYLVNTARGAVVRLDDLLEALDADDLRGAALDVQPVEPPPSDHPVLEHPKVILTPHVAWYSETAEADLRRQTAENVVAWASGQPCNVVS